MATKDTIKRLNNELRQAVEKLEYLKIREPEEYLKEEAQLHENIRLIKLKLFEIIVEDYPRQNPVKWASKKDRILAKLAFMQAGGLEEDFVYKPIAPVAPTAPQEEALVEEKVKVTKSKSKTDA